MSTITTEQQAIKLVRQNGHLLNTIPEHLKTIAVCYAAVNSAGAAIQYVPSKILNQELIDIAIKQNPKNDKYIFLPFITFQQLLTMVNRHEIKIEDAINKYPVYAQQLADKIFDKKHGDIEKIPKKYRTERMFKIIDNDEEDTQLYHFLPDHILTRKHYRDGCFEIETIPPEYLDEEMWLYWCFKNKKNINDVPDHMLTRKFLINFLSQNRYRTLYETVLLPKSVFKDDLILQMAIVLMYDIPKKYRNHPLFQLIHASTGNKRNFTAPNAIEISNSLNEF